MDNLPPLFNSAIFNTRAFTNNDYLTKTQADLLYLPYSSFQYLNYLNTTEGVAEASKALLFDSNRDIININSLTSTTLNSTTTNSTTLNATSLNITNGDINFYGTTGNLHFHDTVSSTILLGASIFNSITMQGSSGFFTMSGLSQYMYIAGANGYLRIDNTSASTSSITGSLRCSGGCYFGNDSYFNTQISISGSILNSTNAGYLVGISAGTGSASKCLVLDVNKDIIDIRNLTATNLTGTLTTTSITLNGTLITASATEINYNDITTIGTAQASKALIVDSNKDIISIRNLTATNLTGTLQTAAQANITSLGTLTALNCSGLINFSNTTASSSNSTGALISNGGICISKNSTFLNNISLSNDATPLYDYDININKSNMSNASTLNVLQIGVNTSTKNRILQDFYYASTGSNSNKYSYKWQGSSSNIISYLASDKIHILDPPVSVGVLTFNSSGGTSIGICESASLYAGIAFSSGLGLQFSEQSDGSNYNTMYFYLNKLSISNTLPRSKLDVSLSTSDCLLTLYQPNIINGATTGFGVNSNYMTLLTHTGYKFYQNSASSQTLGNIICQLDYSYGLTMASGRRISITLDGYGYSHFSGSGVEIVSKASANTDGSIGCYSNHPLNLITNNTSRLTISASGIITTTGSLGIGTTPSCPLHVSGTTNQTTALGFGYLASSGAGTATGFTNRAFSIRSEGGIYVVSGEIDVTSDIRLKKDIKKLDEDIINKFIDNIKPIEFKYKINDKKKHYGFSAQELVKYNFDSLVGFTEDQDDNLEEMTIECVNKDKIQLKKYQRLVVNLLDVIPILTGAIQSLKKKLHDVEFDLQDQINDIAEYINDKKI